MVPEKRAPPTQATAIAVPKFRKFGASPIQILPAAWSKNEMIRVILLPNKSAIAPEGISATVTVIIMTDSRIPMPA